MFRLIGLLSILFLINSVSIDAFSKSEVKSKPKPIKTVDATADMKLWQMCMKSYEIICPIAKYKVAIKQAQCVKEKIKKLPNKCQKRFAEGYNMVMSSLKEGEKKWQAQVDKENKEKQKASGSNQKLAGDSGGSNENADKQVSGEQKSAPGKPIQYLEEAPPSGTNWGLWIVMIALLSLAGLGTKIYLDKKKKK